MGQDGTVSAETPVPGPLGAPVRPDAETVRLERWEGPWSLDDPDANFKADVALYARLEPMTTIRGLAEAVGLPIGAIARYVLARYATAGSGGLLEVGPSMVHRLWEPIERAEELDDDVARLRAYAQLRDMISWLRVPLAAGADGALASSGAVMTEGPESGGPVHGGSRESGDLTRQ
jgi:hypothetical protein